MRARASIQFTAPKHREGGRGRGDHSDSTSVNILLVEDHDESRLILSNLLTHCGQEVANAGNVRDALLLLNHLHFDALVCDIGLPDGSGLDLVVEAKKRQPWKKTVALTGHEHTEEIEEGLRAGFDEYLTKPFDFHQLRSLLAASLSSAHSDLPAASGRPAADRTG